MTQTPKWSGIGAKFAHLTAAHPCFGVKAHYKVARIHLPVAPRCNIQCNYCVRSINKCENRPGVSACILNAEEAIKRLEAEIKSVPNLKVVGIAGPGESLENPSTFETISIVRERWSDLIVCLSTNGLLAEEKADDLQRLGVKTVTITVNAIDPIIGSKIYDWIKYDGKFLRGEIGTGLLIAKQLRGIEALVERGVVVKVNTVLIPEVNMEETPKIAEEAARRGASLMNVIPLIPVHRFKDLRGPTCAELERARTVAERYIPQFRLCRQCRADACGVPGLESKCIGTEYFHG